MTNQYIEYYTNQAGSGLTGFEGHQYQRGHGFFGTIFQNILKPLGRYLGRTALTTGVNVGTDLLKGENFKESVRKNAKLTSKSMINDGIDRLKKFAQTGSGRRRRRRRKKQKKNVQKVRKSVKKRIKRKSKSVIKKKSTNKRKRKIKIKPNFNNFFK